MSIDAAGHFSIGGDLVVPRLGYGAMRLCGPGVWGFPADRAMPGRVLRRAVERGVRLIDTSDAYGPEVNEYQIAEALHRCMGIADDVADGRAVPVGNHSVEARLDPRLRPST